MLGSDYCGTPYLLLGVVDDGVVLRAGLHGHLGARLGLAFDGGSGHLGRLFG